MTNIEIQTTEERDLIRAVNEVNWDNDDEREMKNAKQPDNGVGRTLSGTSSSSPRRSPAASTNAHDAGARFRARTWIRRRRRL